MPKVCVPIITSSFHEAEILIKKSLEVAQLFELYIDYIEDLNKRTLIDLIADLKDRAVCTFRRAKFAERDLLKEEIVELIVSLAGCYVDFDVFREWEFCSAANEKGTEVKLITSYHNYDRTPSLDDLRDVIVEMTKFDPAVFKIACNCLEPKDALTLMSILSELIDDGKRAIVTGMGSHGLGVRVLGGLWGSEWVYAPFNESQSTAPGQISINKLNELYSILSP